MTTDDDLIATRSGQPRTAVRQGRWSYELRGDEVADVRFDGVLLLRAVRPVVRDADWNTVPVSVTDPSTSAADSAPGSAAEDALLRRTLSFQAADIDYAGDLTVGVAEGVLSVDFVGEARSAFQRNRIGLVVLHPAERAGAAVQVRHTDGAVREGQWPLAISPHQPFVDVAAFRETVDGLDAQLDLTGDVFETEDQRNWTDASFKTYSTPLSLPFPVAVAVGDQVRQTVRLTVTGRGRPAPSPSPDDVLVETATAGTVPPVSLGAALYPPPAEPLRMPGLEAILVELTGPEQSWPAALEEATRQAEALGGALDVRLVAADPAAARRAVTLLAGQPVRRLAAFDPVGHLSTAELWEALQDEARSLGLSAALVGGTRAHFTELNRRQADLPADLPALTFSLTPQMHATEVPHILDSLATQRTVVENALRIAAGRPLHIGPITLARRFNAVATGPRPEPAVEAARGVDPLLDTALLAAWTLASVSALAVPGVTSLTYFETAGPRGLLQQDGSARPVADVLQQVAALAGRPRLATSAPAGTAALAAQTDDGVVVLLANLTGAARTVPVRHASEASAVVELAPWGTAALQLR